MATGVVSAGAPAAIWFGASSHWSPSAAPVIDISPPIACTTKSYPGSAAPAPLPKPVIEQ